MDLVRRRPRPTASRPGRRVPAVQILLVLLVVVITGAAVVSYDRMVGRAARQELQNTTDLTEAFLNQQTAGAVALIASVTAASNVEVALQTPDSPTSMASIRRIHEILAPLGPTISSVVVTDATGRALSILPQLLPDGTDLSSRPWYRQAVGSSGSYTISPVFESTAVKGRFVFIIALPIRLNGDPQGRLLGVVAIAQQLTGDQQFVDSYTKDRAIRLTVLDASGAVAVQSGTTQLALGSAEQRLTAGRALLEPSRDEITVAGSGSSAGADAAVTGNDWRVITQVSKSVALRPAAIFRVAAVSGGALLLLALLLFGWVRRRAERARQDSNRYLEQSHTRIRDLADSSPDLLFRMTADGTVVFASRSSADILGLNSDELIGQDLIAMLDAEGPADLRARLATLMADGEPQQFVARTAGVPGGPGPRIVEGSLRCGLTEDVSEVWGALRDITDRRSARDQIEQLFQLSEDFMAVIDFDGRLVQVNPVWAAAFELDGQRLEGTEFVNRFQGADRKRVGDELARMVVEPAVTTFENRYFRDGGIRTLLWTAASDPLRRLIYAVGRDITEHKELAQALIETRDEALEASRVKSEFVATMSHEIRTPMNGVIGLTDLLLETPLDATQRRYVEGVRTAGDALLGVINDILDFSKIEAGRLQLDSVDFRLEDVVDDVVTLVRQSSMVKGLDLTVDFDPGVPFALNGDPGRLRQILLNLAHNAVKFTEQGGISVQVGPGPARSDGQVSVIFTVSDSGIGIDPEQMDQLFEPFRQADEGATRAYGGTGLGLSICRRLADLMNGTITATSELGQGARFVAELVFTPAADWGRAVRGRDARGLAVLVVDDNEVNRLVMVTQLSRWGMRPVAAASAAEAMEHLAVRAAPAGGYDLAVIDMHMPGTDGLGLVRQLRAIESLATLPVIMLTSDETIRPEVAQEYGISARLTKPVQQSALFDALTRVGVSSPVGSGNLGSTGLPTPVTTAEYGTDRHRSPVGFRLLLVEDNDINQTVALGILTQLGYQVDVAGDGLQALAMAGQHAYDAILMDCQMPKMDGYAATVELRKRPATRVTPIIAMTAATFAADRQRCFDSGMDDFIAKPVRAATLQATLNRWLRADESADSSAQPAGQISGPPPGQPGDRPGLPDHVSAVRESVTAAREEVAAVPQPRSESIDPPVAESFAERIAELLGDGEQFEVDMVREIIASFLSRTVDLLQRLTLAVAADDAESAYLHAHSLTGAGLNLGAEQVVRISRLIEADAKAGRPALSVNRLVELEVALDRARVQLRDLAAGLPDGAPTPGA